MCNREKKNKIKKYRGKLCNGREEIKVTGKKMEKKNAVALKSDDREKKNNAVKDALGIMEEQRQDKK